MDVIIWGCGGYYSLVSGIIKELEEKGIIQIKAYVCKNAKIGEKIDGHPVVDWMELGNIKL